MSEMDNRGTEQLIESLSRGLEPVRPLRPPVRRALLWMAAVALAIGLGLLRFADLAAFAARYAEPRMALEATAMLLTGITAVIAAFHLSLPDRSSLWRYDPLPPLALWIGTSSLGCLQYGLGLGPPGHLAGESTHCFAFIVGVSVPLAVLLYVVLRRARPLDRTAHGIIREVRVTLCRRRLPMAECLSDDRQAFAQPGKHAGKAVPQIVDPNIRKPGARSNALPRLLRPVVVGPSPWPR